MTTLALALTDIGFSMQCNSILQWNLNGLRSRLSHLQTLIYKENPKILVLQELKVNENNNIYIKDFDKVYKKCRNNRGGGVCIAVHKSLPATPIDLNTELEAVACKVYFKNFSINICNVYFNNEANINNITLTNLINAIPSPKLILGDVNAKHPLWGSPTSDQRGITIRDTIIDYNMTVLNDGSHTYYNAKQNIMSHLDITICTNNVSHKFSWKTYIDKFTSDHYPIFIKYNMSELYTSKPRKWKYQEANWRMYKNNVSLPNYFYNPMEDIQTIVCNIISSATEAIPQTGTKTSNKYCCFWWNNSCNDAINQAGRQLKNVYRNHNPANVREYYRLDAIARRTLLEAKRTSWIEYLSTANKDTPSTQL